MPSRRSPSQREKAFRIDRTLGIFGGSHAGRVTNATPPTETVVPSVPAPNVAASGLAIVSSVEPVGPPTGQFWLDTGSACDGGAAAPSFVSADSAFAQPATTITTSPASIAVGDILVTFLHSYVHPPTGPAGWSVALTGSDSTKSWAALTRVADAGDVGATFTWTPGDTGYPMHAITVVTRGGSAASPVGATPTNGGATFPEAPSVIAPAGGGLLVGAFLAERGVFSGDPTPLGVPAGMTWREEVGGGGGGLLAATETVVAGATGARDSTSPYNPSYNVGMSVLVAAATGQPLKLWDGAIWRYVACTIPA